MRAKDKQADFFTSRRHGKTTGGESLVVRAVIEVLSYHPLVAKVWRQNAGRVKVYDVHGNARYVYLGPKDIADVSGFMKDGRRIEIECKAIGNKLSDSQRDWGEYCLANGVIWGLAYSADEAVQIINDTAR